MKKSLLILGSLAFSLQFVDAQVLTYVGNAATFTVKDGALVYSGGGWQNDGSGAVSNEGDIMVAGDNSKDLFEVKSGANFNLKFIDPATYGQLYITGVPQTRITGKVNKEYQADTNNSTSSDVGRQQTSLPFFGYTIQDLQSSLPYVNVTNTALNGGGGRFNVSSVFKWNNTKARFDQISGGAATVVGGPTDYYILPRRDQSNTVVWNAVGVVKNFAGTPSADTDAEVKVSLTGGASYADFSGNGNIRNAFNERYNSYLNDPFRIGGPAGTLWEADYGRNLYQYANPFLTNIDLTNIGINEGTNGDGIELKGLVGIATYGSGNLDWKYGTGSTYTTSATIVATAAADGSLQAGDVRALVIKPMQEFMIKMQPNSTSTDFAMQNTRRFAQTSRAAGIDYNVTAARMARTSNIPTDQIVKQVAAILKDGSGNEIGRTYYAVMPSATTGFSPNAVLQSYIGNYPIYTKEELTTGGEDTNQLSKLYINAANEIDFAGKEIPLRIEDTNATSLSFELYEAGRRLNNNELLSTGKSFYVKVDNALTKITDGGSVKLTPNAVFGLYYDTPQGTLGNGEVGVKSQTVVAKSGSNWVVRFAKDWKNANVEVYSASGQLIHSQKKVSTSQDYVIPVNTTGMYIVRTTSDSGEVVTKKIVK